jgi:hypothetical protein
MLFPSSSALIERRDSDVCELSSGLVALKSQIGRPMAMYGRTRIRTGRQYSWIVQTFDLSNA